MDRKQDLGKLIKEAQNGIMADKIRGLDLSKEEDRDELRYLMSPWGGVEGGIEQDEKIYNTDGTKMFPGDYIEHNFGYGSGGLLNLGCHLREIESKYLLEDKFSDDDIRSTVDAIKNINGHSIVKMPYNFSNIFGFSEGVMEKDVNISYLSYTALFVGETLNKSFVGSALYYLIESQDIKNNPNYPIMKKLIEKHREFFCEWNSVFFRYLSHQLQDQKLIYDGISPENYDDVKRSYLDMDKEYKLSDYHHSEKSYDFRKSFSNEELKEKSEGFYSNPDEYRSWPRDFASLDSVFTRIKLERSLYDERLEKRVRECIAKIDYYTNVLREFNERVPYAKSKKEEVKINKNS